MKLVPLFVLLALLVPLQCYKILVYIPQMGHSHMNFLGHLADTLVRAGNDVVVYTPEYDSTIKTNGTKLARIIKRPNDKKIKLDQHLSNNAWTKNGEDLSEVYYMISRIAIIQRVACQGTLGDEKILAQLRAEKFDLGISEVLSMCGFGIFEKIGLKKYIGAFATNLIPSLTKPFAIDNNPSYVPSSFARSSDVMSYSERMSNFIGSLVTEAVGRITWDTTVAAAFQNYLPDDFNIKDQISKSSFLFVNSEEFVEFPRPITHKVVYVGGIAVDKPKPLNGELKKVMDAAVNGAVVISFGSIAQSYKMTPEIKNSFVEVMRSFPEIQFVWKYEIDDDVAIGLPNVLKVKWVPQNDLLSHPNTRAFVSHGGMNGVTESVRAGVPLVCVPLFGDQMRNAKMVEKRGVSIYLDKMNLTSQSLHWALQSVLEDSRYLTSSRRLANMIKKKPFSAEERIVKYADFAVEFGAIDNLDSAARQLNVVQYYLIDIIVPLLIALFAFLYAVAKVIVFILRIFMGASKSKVE